MWERRVASPGAVLADERAREQPRTSLVVYGANAVAELLRSGEPVARLRCSRARAADEDAWRGWRARAGSRSRSSTARRSTGSRGRRTTRARSRRTRRSATRSSRSPRARPRQRARARRRPGPAQSRRASCAPPGRPGSGGVVLPARPERRHHPGGRRPPRPGYVFGLPIARVPNLVRAMEALKGAGCWTGRPRTPRAGRRSTPSTAAGRPALVVGGEGEGLRPLVRRTLRLRRSACRWRRASSR